MSETKITEFKCLRCEIRVSTASFSEVTVFCTKCDRKMNQLEKQEAAE